MNPSFKGTSRGNYKRVMEGRVLYICFNFSTSMPSCINRHMDSVALRKYCSVREGEGWIRLLCRQEAFE